MIRRMTADTTARPVTKIGRDLQACDQESLIDADDQANQEGNQDGQPFIHFILCH